MRIRLSTDLLTGLLFLALGAFAIIYGSRYSLGTAARMGPGYYPLLASSGLILLGLVLIVRSLLTTGEAIGAINLRPLTLILAGTLTFGLLIDRAGLIIAGLCLVFAARLADKGFRLLEVAILAVCLVALALAIFRYGLGMPLRLWPAGW
jgi:putative tricarboxylic transport membrane protein